MIKEDDLLFSKMSYTDKDFASIYPDLLDLAKELTDKWDPSLSNESDPGVVLLKEGAFIADHNNYNIDKNVLENFLPTATQESSVRNILELNGYTPEYYISAKGDVTFTYSPEEEPESFNGFNIPPFSMVITNSDETVYYTQVSALSISAVNLSSTATFIQGELRTLSVNESDTILLENLDDNNRVYFPVKQVAANGIFINNVTSGTADYWERKDYISTQPLNSKVYKVGYDSSLGVPYVEFPSDIANIIGNGLNISYIVSSGEEGNAKANTLTKISTPATFSASDIYSTVSIDISSEDFNLSNNTSIMNGKDPETINEMYRSFKKVVGTFDTLVTCNDYANAIYNADDGTNKLVSNAVVTDRNNDYNNALKIITYDQWGEYFEVAAKLAEELNINLKASKPSDPQLNDIYLEGTQFKRCTGFDISGEAVWEDVTNNQLGYSDFLSMAEAMTPFDLCIYALKAFSLSDYLDSNPAKAIENSFEPISETTYNAIVDEDTGVLVENKCINHTFLSPELGDVICFKNYVPLNITITPYSKVTKQEKESIIDNIYQALSKNFNASMVDFGEELSYDAVLEVLLECDDRIKNIRLEDFEYIPTAMIKTSSGYSEVPLYSTAGADILLEVVAKNVLAGRLCLFDFDDEFTCTYGQVNDTVYSNIASLATEVVKEVTNSTEEVSYEDKKTSKTTIKATVSEIKTKIALTGATSESKGSLEIPVGETVQIDPDSIFYTNIRGNIKQYYSDGVEYELFLTNNTDSIIALQYDGVEERTWVELGEGNVVLTNSYTSASTENYNLSCTLKANEYIEIAYNNYITDATFPTYVAYRFEAAEGTEIEANTDYVLQTTERIKLAYTENDVQKLKIYEAGEVIRANFNLKWTDSSSIVGKTKEIEGYEAEKYATLSASQQIEHRVLMKTELNLAKTPCYWLMNNNSNTLFYDATSTQERTNEVILSSGEYFIYSNSNKDSMVILGPGSLLRRSETDDNNWSIPNRSTYKDIETNGFNADIEWKYQDFSGDKKFEHQEMNIITLTEGDILEISDWAGTSLKITNKWVECNGTIHYTISGSSQVTLPTLPDGEAYKLRSRLDVALNNVTGQAVVTDQTFSIVYEDGSTATITGTDATPAYIQSSTELNLYGGSQINLSDYTSDDATVDFKVYNKDQVKLYTDKYTLQEGSDLLQPETITYYNIVNNQYKAIAASRFDPYIAKGVTTFGELYADESWPEDDYCYTLTEDTAGVELTETNGKYSINVKAPGRAEFMIGYECEYSELSDDHKEYILPVFLNYGGSPITAELEDTETEEAKKLTIKIQDYNIGSPAESITLDNTEMYLLRVCIEGQTSTVKAKLKFTLSWDTLPETGEVLNVYNPNIINGMNTGFGSNITLDSLLEKINDLITNSTKPNTKPYYIYKPEDSIAIQTNDIEDPNIFWDKNNVINCMMIPQIDIRTMANKDYPTIDIIKSMRNYK